MVLEVVSSRPRISGTPYFAIKPTKANWLINGVLPMKGTAFLAGAHSAGKTFLALDIALRLARGNKVFSQHAKHVGVAYVAAEDPAGFNNRIEAWRLHWRFTDVDAPFELYTQPINLLSERDVLDLCDGLEFTKQRFDAMGVPLGLVIIDTLSRCLPGVEENSSTGMSQALRSLKEISDRTEALVLSVAHFGKSGEERGIRGWSGMDSGSDATLTLEKGEDDPELRVMTLSKVKNGRSGRKLAFRLLDIPLGLKDDYGEEIKSCVCDYEQFLNSPAPRRKAMSRTEKVVYDTIVSVSNAKGQFIPTDIPGVKPHTTGISRAQLSVALMGTAFWVEGEKDNTATKRMSRSLMHLCAQKRVRVQGDLIWATP